MFMKIIDAKSSWSGVIKQGQRLKITDIEGQQAVDFLCYDNGDCADR